MKQIWKHPVEAAVIRKDPRWNDVRTWSALFDDMTVKYGKVDACKIWIVACNVGASKASV